MLTTLCIFLDDDFARPLYAEPGPDDMESDAWSTLCEMALEAIEGDRPATGTETRGEHVTAWRCSTKNGLTFIASATDVESGDMARYLKDLVQDYYDEVDDVRRPDRDGVDDIVASVIPPWED